MFTGIKMSFIREVLDNVTDLRFQENVARKFDSSASFIGCVGETPSDQGNNTFTVKHSLGKSASGFVILTQATSGSIKATLVKSDSNTATLSFSKAPGSFTVFLY